MDAGLLFEPGCLPPELHSHSSPTMSQFLSEQWEFEYQTRRSRRYMFQFPHFWSSSHGSEWCKFYCLDYTTKELFWLEFENWHHAVGKPTHSKNIKWNMTPNQKPHKTVPWQFWHHRRKPLITGWLSRVVADCSISRWLWPLPPWMLY